MCSADPLRSFPPPFRLQSRLVEPTTVAASAGHHLLAIVAHGPTSGVPSGDAVVAHTPLEPLSPPLVEVFETPRELRRDRSHGIELAEDGTVLFGHVEIADGPLELTTRDAFARLLRVVQEHGYPHPLRFWVTVPGINETENGLERYQAFCRGRSLAFEAAHGAGFTRRLCASSAVGSESGALSIHFLAAREPGVHWENPRQVAAYSYPSGYGPRSPSFARATIAPAALGGPTFIAGTASIVGHESRHPGDVEAQLRETVENLDALVASLPRLGHDRSGRFQLLKVYLRHSGDLPAVRRALELFPRLDAPTLFLRADICRRALLVEIEAIG